MHVIRHLSSEDRTRLVSSPPFTITDLVRARAGDERVGLVFEDQQWTYREVIEEASRRARLFLDVPGEGPPHIGILLDNVPDFAFWLAAGALAGAAIVPFNPTRRGAELAGDIAHMQCRLLITESRHRELLWDVDLPFGTDQLLDVDSADYVARLKGSNDSVPEVTVEPTTPFLYVFTSGSTGAPKACRMSHGRLAVAAKFVRATHSLVPDDVLYEAMPFFHSSILASCWASGWAAGACHVMRRRFSASGFLEDVRRHGATYFGYVGKPLAYILATSEQPDDADNPLRRGQGNEASPLDIARFSARFGCEIRDGYGSTEGCVTITRTADTPFGALGASYSTSTCVMNPDSLQECPPARLDANGVLLNADEAVGEIVDTNGAATFEGYYDNAEAERSRIRNGWYWSGDLAYRDADGWFYFAGRNGDMIRVDGENLSTAVIERIMERHKDVVAAAAYGLHTDVGDDLVVCVELRDDRPFDATAFRAFLDEQDDLGLKMRPRYIRVARHLPLTASQKLDRRALRSEALETTDQVWERDRAGDYRRRPS